MTTATFLQDVRYGLRTFVRSRVTAAMAIGAIAIGTGGNTAMFSAINSILLRPLPFDAPNRLVAIWSFDTARQVDARYMSYPDFDDLRRRSRTLQTLAAWYTRDFAMTTPSGALHLNVAVVTPSLLPMLGVAPQLGRAFEAGSAADLQTVVLGHGVWQQAFGADRGVIGRTVVINAAPHTIIGVMPPDFRFPIQAKRVDAWTMMPDGGGLLAFRKARLLSVAGRLADGATLPQAEAELATIADALRREHPGSNANIGVGMATLADSIFGRVRPGLLVLFGAVSLVLLIACATVANLLIAHGATRGREIAVRTALGATRARLVRQLLTESMLLAVPGALIGAALGFAACRLFLALSPVESLRLREIHMDLRVLGFTILLACVTGVLFGLTPALRLVRAPAAGALQDRSATGGHGAHRRLVQGALVVSQVAITLVLLVGAGLLIAGFRRLADTSIGLDTTNVLSLKLALPDSYDPPRIRAFYSQFQQDVSALPGVVAVSSVSPLPLSGDNIATDFTIDGQAPDPGAPPSADLRIVQPQYFRTVGVRLLGGRDFDARDTDTAPPVAIVNDVLAERYFDRQSPLGRQITQGGKSATIVGVVSSIRHDGPKAAPRAELYLPYLQRPFAEMVAVVKTEQDPARMVGALRRAVSAADPSLPFYDIRTLDERLDASVAQERFNMTLLLLFAAVALFLTLVGLHGVMSQFVAQRRQEIAVRMAFGASRASVLALVVGEGMALVAAGLALGVAGAFAVTRVMQSILAGVSATDPVVFTTVAVLLGAVGLLTCYRPAARACTVDPMVLLRQEQ